jgi:hypothetical protein
LNFVLEASKAAAENRACGASKAAQASCRDAGEEEEEEEEGRAHGRAYALVATVHNFARDHLTFVRRASLARAETRFLSLLPQLRAAERNCRARYKSVSGYEVNRSTSETLSLGDALRDLEQLEQEVATILNEFEQSEVADLAVAIAQLLDAGSHDFFSGSRRTQGKFVMTAARRALCRQSGGAAGAGAGASGSGANVGGGARSGGGKEREEEGEEDDESEASHSSRASCKEGEAAAEAQRLEAAEHLRVEHLVSAYAYARLLLARCVSLTLTPPFPSAAMPLRACSPSASSSGRPHATVTPLPSPNCSSSIRGLSTSLGGRARATPTLCR